MSWFILFREINIVWTSFLSFCPKLFGFINVYSLIIRAPHVIILFIILYFRPKHPINYLLRFFFTSLNAKKVKDEFCNKNRCNHEYHLNNCCLIILKCNELREEYKRRIIEASNHKHLVGEVTLIRIITNFGN